MSGLNAFGVKLYREENRGEGDFEPIAQIESLSGPGMEREEIDVTAHDSPDAWREYVFGLKDAGEVDVDLNFSPNRHAELLEDYNSHFPRRYKIVWPDPFNTVWGFDAGLTSFEVEAPHDDKLEASATFKLSGKPEFEADDPDNGDNGNGGDDGGTQAATATKKTSAKGKAGVR